MASHRSKAPGDWTGSFQAWLSPERALGLQLPDPVTAAVPWFFVLILVELLAAARMGRRVYNLRQSISNVAGGVLTTLLGAFTKALHIFPYCWLHSRLSLLPAAHEDSLLVNAAAFLLVDFGFYCFHRAAHASNLGWSAHVVHHSSPDFNLSTALRQGMGESTFSWLFYLPLALFASPSVYALHRGINTVYQFFTHSQLVPKLWWPIELVFNTPSHHRVHHARNYGRRNFAGLLIIWDRLLGTFEEEDSEARPCIYGLDAQKVVQGSYNPLWHQAHHLLPTLRLAAAALAGRSTKAGALTGVLAALLTRQLGPGMVGAATLEAAPAAAGERSAAANGGRPTAGASPEAQKTSAQPIDTAGEGPWEQRPGTWLDIYAALHFFGSAVPLGFVLLLHSPLLATAGLPGAVALVGGTALVAWGVVSAATLCGASRGAVAAELLRLATWAAAALWLALGASDSVDLHLQPWARWLAWAVFSSSLLSAPLLARLLWPGSALLPVGSRTGAKAGPVGQTCCKEE